MTGKAFMLTALVVVGAAVVSGGAFLGYRAMAGGSQSPVWTVMMENSAYSPSILTIQAGDRVTWMNHDAVDHNVASDAPDGPLNSPFFGQMRSWTFTFDAPGTYDYHCDPHAVRQADGSYVGMLGRIVVEP